MPTETASTEPLSEVSRLIGVFAYPKRAFTDIVERPAWFVPVILIVVASLCMIYLFAQHVGFDRLIQQAFDQSSRAQNMTAEQRAQAVSTGMKMAGVMGYVGAVIGPVIYVLVTAAVLMFMFNAMFSTHIRYQQMAAITAYSFLTGLVAIAMTIIIMFIKSPDDFDLRNPLSFNVGFYLSQEQTPKWLMSIATSLDLFSFWTMGLLAVGVAVASRKLSWSNAFLAILMPWGLWVIVKAGWAAIFG